MTDFPSTPPEQEPATSGYDEWPQRGGDQAQPWDRKALGLEGDEPNPVELSAGLPIIGSGSVGPEVRNLGVQLGELGYANSVSKGQNPYGIYDQSVGDAVDSFRRDYNVAEDPSAFLRDPSAQASSHAGPWTVLAIQRAAEREQAAA